MSRLDWMVVIGVVAGLGALVMPALSKQRAGVRTIQCVANLRMFGMALEAYGDDHDMSFPLNYDGLPGVGDPPGWVPEDMMGWFVRLDGRSDKGSMRTGIASYLPQREVFKCPADRSDRLRSIAMNCRLNPVRSNDEPRWLGGAGTNYPVFRRRDQIRAPASTFTVLDEDEDSINDGYFAVDLSNTGDPYARGPVIPLSLVDFPARRHRSGAAVLFGDGHAERIKWRDVLLSKGGRYPGMRATLESHDARWLHESSVGIQIYEDQ